MLSQMPTQIRYVYIYIMVLCIVCRVSFMVMPGYLGNRLFNM